MLNSLADEAVTNSGGSLTDLWPLAHRSVPLALFTAASFLGPVIAPIVGGFLTQYGSVCDSIFCLLNVANDFL